MRHALSLALLVQATLLLPALDRASPWGDELFTLDLVSRPLAEMFAALGADVHPPLYFLLARLLPAEPAWQRLPGVLFALASTVALDRLFLRHDPAPSSWMNPGLRERALLLWALSPALLLYAPMARSYSLQVLLGLVTVAGLLRLRAGERGGWALALLGGIPLAWTHHLPTLAIGAAALIFGNRNVRIATLIMLVSIAPWAPHALDAAVRWWERGEGYLVSGSPLLEHVPRLGWWALTFTVGEASPGDALVGLFLAVPLVLLAAVRGSWRRPELGLALVAALVGYVGVARWSSYPFVPARMLFLLPFFVLAVARGLGRTGTFTLATLNIVAVVAWTDGRLLNRGYATPHREMAASMQPCDRVLVDTTNSDDTALRRYLPPDCEVRTVSDDASADAALTALNGTPFWYWRNTHDVTSGVHARLVNLLSVEHVAEPRWFGPYSGPERLLMKGMGWAEVPRHQFVLERWEPTDKRAADAAK